MTYTIFHINGETSEGVSRIKLRRHGVWCLYKWGKSEGPLGQAGKFWEFYPWPEVSSIRREK